MISRMILVSMKRFISHRLASRKLYVAVPRRCIDRADPSTLPPIGSVAPLQVSFCSSQEETPRNPELPFGDWVAIPQVTPAALSFDLSFMGMSALACSNRGTICFFHPLSIFENLMLQFNGGVLLVSISYILLPQLLHY